MLKNIVKLCYYQCWAASSSSSKQGRFFSGYQTSYISIYNCLAGGSRSLNQLPLKLTGKKKSLRSRRTWKKLGKNRRWFFRENRRFFEGLKYLEPADPLTLIV